MAANGNRRSDCGGRVLGHSAAFAARVGRESRCRFTSLLARIGVAAEASQNDQVRCVGGPAPKQIVQCPCALMTTITVEDVPIAVRTET